MALTPGTRLGPYEILAPLGAGGMGQVWSARDSRLDRTVAIKVAGEQFSERFEREARHVAALNHPNICTLFDVGPDYLVMELVEGPTLAERIAAGPIPLAEALGIAHQIADALEAAHEKGIVHRDLKLANVKLTNEGKVKVLDFGLAKARDPESSAGNPATSPTLTLSATQAGMILGTAGYMSPEQARGKIVDRRADIWSFGVVLYEMICGRQLYSGELASDLLAAVILKEPDWEPLPAGTPVRIRELLERCLRKDPKIRLRDIGDARIAIEEYLAKPDGPQLAMAAPVVARRMPLWLMAAAGLLAVGLVVLAAIHFGETPAESPLMRFQIQPPDKGRFASGMALSPDGKRLAFPASDANGRISLWVQSLDSLTAQALPGTEGATSPFWSPDSRFVAFLTPGKLSKIEASGGPVQTLCEVPNTGVGGSWSRDGVILFGTNATGLFRVPQAGGVAAPVTTLDAGEAFHSRPWFLPDGRHFLYYAAQNSGGGGIYLMSLGEKDRKRLMDAQQGAIYAPPAPGANEGYVLYLRDGVLVAQPLNAASLVPAGDAIPVAEHVGVTITLPYFSASSTGVLTYRVGVGLGNTKLSWFDRDGKQTGMLGPPSSYADVALSPGGERVAVNRATDQQNNRDIWLLDVAHGVPTRFTFGPSQETYPVWSPDGKRLVFASNREGTVNFYIRDSGGSGSEELLLKDTTDKRPYDWSADGRFLIYSVNGLAQRDLWVLNIGAPLAERKPKLFLSSPYDETQGQFSPPAAANPRWVAYTSNESGRYEIYVQPFTEDGSAGAGKFQISSEGGVQPRWRGDGKELFYLTPDSRLMAVSVKTAPPFEHGIPKELFRTRVLATGLPGAANLRYSPSADGKRFLINVLAEDSAPSPITAVINWTAGLRR